MEQTGFSTTLVTLELNLQIKMTVPATEPNKDETVAVTSIEEESNGLLIGLVATGFAFLGGLWAFLKRKK